MRIDEEAYREAAREAVVRALEEDRVEDDVTTNAVVTGKTPAAGRLLFRKSAVLAGVVPFEEAFLSLDPGVEFDWSAAEGDAVGAGETVCRVSGAASTLLRAERVALNFLMRLSGIATLAARFVEAVGERVEILDTRKTTPGLRLLEKRAVLAGGGTNHRLDLSTLALIKENHVALAGGIREAVEAVRLRSPGVPIEVEVRSLEELELALPLRVERIMLDNFDLGTVRLAVARAQKEKETPYLELSGGVDLARAKEAADIGVDGISIGALTHSAPAADVSFLIEIGS
ncbi:MAG: carboxylating nicotinate-nucleotide diphosphorylase [Candidatus Latescibacterota bacterium]|nr:MAG: carboxylating nicotinate-nucleotide diphosphorylase [Candidatus Latescibacterota bacterium]